MAAWAALDTVASERVPLWAAHWLARGHDGEALRTLAGLNEADPREVNDILRAALANCDVTVPDSPGAAAHVAFIAFARLLADDRVTERWVLDRVGEVVSDSCYADSVLDLPLGQILALDDEWGTDWGRPEQELAIEIQDACKDQLAMSHTSA
ncbi:hypothetical protein [Streptoalloteichus hindustanus]|uniref:hypothetical protein n=1 Tax=Streptoalloteichus hindustanus TaxID=2017 RepID=UPI000A026D70|nr:hypothetical protein [Streptoalloteichus hindustanus]